MNIGEKIRSLRRERGMTQAQVSGDKITRNMLSAIENGTASPSLETLAHIAEALDAPLSYLVSEDTDIGYYKKKEVIGKIRDYYKCGSYEACTRLVEKLGVMDDELALILACCYFELGKKAVKNGSLLSAKDAFSNSEKYAEMTVYATERIRMLLPLYRAVAENIQAPLLEFDSEEYLSKVEDNTEYEFFRYISMQSDYEYKTPLFRLHMEAKALMRARKYVSAIPHLLQIEQMKSVVEYNAHVMLGVYTDLELCYREVCDFERAYRYSSKRISLMEGFKS